MAQGESPRLSHLLGMLAVWGCLIGWSSAAAAIGCRGGALLLLPLWVLMTLSGIEWPWTRRTVFVQQYLEAKGVLARWMRRRSLLLIWQGLKSLALALVLLVSVLAFDAAEWLVLAADILLLAVLVFLADWALHGQLKTWCAGVVTRQWVHRTNALLLWLALLTLLFFGAHEDYHEMRLAEVVRFSATQVAVGCDALAVLARLSAVSEAVLWWSAQNLFAGLVDPGQVVIAWAAFLAAFGASFVTAWGYSRALVGVLARPWRAGVAPSGGTGGGDTLVTGSRSG